VELVYYEKAVDVDNKLNKHLKITGIKNNMLSPQTIFKETRIKFKNILALPFILQSSENGPLKQETQRNDSSRDEIYEENSRINLDRL